MAEPSTILEDFTQHDLMVLRYTGAFTADEYGAHLRRVEADIRRRREANTVFGAIVDIEQAPPLEGAIRTEVSDFWRRANPDLKKVLVCVCYVSTSRLMKGAIAALNWFSPLPVAFAMRPTLDEGRGWVRGKVDERRAQM